MRIEHLYQLKSKITAGSKAIRQRMLAKEHRQIGGKSQQFYNFLHPQVTVCTSLLGTLFGTPSYGVLRVSLRVLGSRIVFRISMLSL